MKIQGLKSRSGRLTIPVPEAIQVLNKTGLAFFLLILGFFLCVCVLGKKTHDQEINIFLKCAGLFCSKKQMVIIENSVANNRNMKHQTESWILCFSNSLLNWALSPLYLGSPPAVC